MDPMEHRQMDQTPIMKLVAKGATNGLVTGICLGSIVPIARDVPRVGVLRGLILSPDVRRYGLTCAAASGVMIGVTLLLEKHRKKKDVINEAVGGFVAGACYWGYTGRSIKKAIAGGTAFAAATIVIGHLWGRFMNHKSRHPQGTLP